MRITINGSNDGNGRALALGGISALILTPVNAALITWAVHLLFGMWEAGEPDMWRLFWAVLLLRVAW